MRNRITLEMSVGEFNIIKEALDNYKERLTYLQERNEGRFESYQELKDKEKRLLKVMEELNK